MSLMTANCWL